MGHARALGRERVGRHHEALGRFLAENRLGAAVISETPMLHVIVGVGVPASRRAFTYPQINQLRELAAIIESALERTLMVLKIQHTEQLATVGLLGASLAPRDPQSPGLGQGHRAAAAPAATRRRSSGRNSFA